MDIKAILLFQIIADVILCIAIVLLLVRVGKNIKEVSPSGVDDQTILRLQKLLAESQHDAAGFLHTLEESCKKLSELASGLEERERKLRTLISEAQRQIEKYGITNRAVEDYFPEKGSGLILKCLKEGMSIEAIAKSYGLTAGEVSLIIDLENKKREVAER